MHSHFVIKPWTLKYDLRDSFYAKILSNKVFFIYVYNCILIFIQGFIFVVANGDLRRGPRLILPKFARAYFFEKKKKKLPVNVLGVVLRYLLTKIFLAAKYAARNNSL